MKEFVIVVGAMVILLGIGALLYTEPDADPIEMLFDPEDDSRPYEGSAMPLLLSGMVLVVFGVLFPRR